MNRFLFLILFSINFWSCDDKEEATDSIPPNIEITYPPNNSTVSEIVNISCISSDNEGVEKVELWINNSSTGLSDTTEPYSFSWNTLLLINNNYKISIRSYDINQNFSDSEPINVIVDNSQSAPVPLNITSIVYNLDSLHISWNKSLAVDFNSYKVLYNNNGSSSRDTLITNTAVSDTTYAMYSFDPTIENWFWVMVSDTLGLYSIGQSQMIIDQPPIPSELSPIVYENDTLFFNWSENQETDFQSYHLYQSNTENMDSPNEIFNTNEQTITNFSFPSIELEMQYFQLVTNDIWNQSSQSDIKQIIVYPVSDLNNYSIINQNTSWFITNQNYNYFNVGHTYFNVAFRRNNEIFFAEYCSPCDRWQKDMGGYIYSDLDNNNTLELWQFYLKEPWPNEERGFNLFSNDIDYILQTNDTTSLSNSDYYTGNYGLTQVRKPVLADLNNDNENEIVLFSSGQDISPPPGDSIGIFYASLNEYQFLSEQIGYWHGGACGDIDQNGFSDIISYTGNGIGFEAGPIAYMNNGNNSFEISEIFSAWDGTLAPQAYTIELFDINDDDYLDLFLAGETGNLFAVLGNSVGTFDFGNKIQLPINQNEEPMDIDFFDFNKDGLLDVLVNNNLNSYSGHNCKVLIQTENLTFTDNTEQYFDQTEFYGQSLWIKWLHLKDIDYDGDIDIMADGLFGFTYNFNDDIVYWENILGTFYYRHINGSALFNP